MLIERKVTIAFKEERMKNSWKGKGGDSIDTMETKKGDTIQGTVKRFEVSKSGWVLNWEERRNCRQRKKGNRQNWS